MALFKINKGLAENLAKNMPYAKEGFAYFTKDDGKFYIDIDGDGTTTEAIVNVNRIPLNAAKADVATMIQATAMATDDNKVYPILAFNITDSTKNLVEAKYSQIGIKNGTLVIPSVEDKDEILISNEGLGRGIVIDNKGTNNAIEILNGKGIKVAQDPTDDLELATKQYVDNQNVVLKLSISDDSINWANQTSYDFTLDAKAQTAYSRLREVIKKGYTPTVIISDIDNVYIYKYSFIQNIILTSLLVFTVEIPLSQDGNHISRDFIAFQPSNISGTTLTVQRLNKPLEYVPGDGEVNQILATDENGWAKWINIPSIGDLGGATKDHNHDDRYYTEAEIDDKLKVLLGANDAMIFKGIINKNTDLPDTHETGWTYRVNKAGTYVGKVCEIGDLVICVTDGLSANDSHWTVAQTNIDGAVIGPNTSTTNAVSTFADATGKVIKNNSTVTIDDTGLFTAPYIATGDDATHYFQSRRFRGEGDANSYYHAIDFGYSGHNQVDFHEYGGIWNFYRNTKGTATDGELVASIQPDGFHGNLNGNATTATMATKAGSADKVNNNLIIKLNSGTTEGTNQFTYNGSAVKNINITPANIGAASSSHDHDSNYVKKAGDTITGNINFQKTNTDGTTSTTVTIGADTGYITGTQLQTTSVGNKVGDFATIDSSGWIYKRTAAQARQDMGLSTAMHFIGKATVDITDGSTVNPKITGYTTKTAGDVIIDKNNSYEYVWTLENKWERLGPDGSYSVVGHNHDDKYVIKSGDVMSGTLRVSENGIGSDLNCDGVSLANNSILLCSGGYEDYEYLQLGSGSQRPDIFIDRPGNPNPTTSSLPRDENISSETPALSIRGNNLQNGFTFYIDKLIDPETSVDSGMGKIWLRSLTNQTVQLKGICSPTEDEDAANKYYVDDQIQTNNSDVRARILSTVSKTYVKKAGDTMTGLLKTNGSIENQGEAKFTHPTYCPDIEDTAENIGCAFKASRGHFNQMNVNEIYLPATTTTSYEGNKISFKSYSGGNNGAYANVSEVASINKQGFTIPGTDTADRYFRATNSNGSIGLLTSTNQGLYDYTNSKWILYHNKSDGINYFNGLATKATQDKNGLQIDSNYLKLSGGTMSGKITFKFTTSKPAKGTRLPVLSGQYQNGSGAYYSTDLVDMIGTASTNVNNAAVRFVSTNGATFITSGEGGCVFPSKLNSNLVDCENISFCADGGFNFWGNISNDGSTYTSYMNMSGTKITAYQPLYGAVWNDYAEFREGDTIEAGHCVIEVGDDTLITSTERLMLGANITSDTFGFAIGETEQAKTPIAVSGRVLAYPYESREEFKKNIGRPVCSGPNGTVSIMTDEEYRDKGYCAIGTISAVPDYEEWGTGKVKVNGRVWIKVF